MSQSIIGLDLGTYSVKLVEINRDFKDFSFVRAKEARIPLDPKISRIEAFSTVLQEQFGLDDLNRKTVICGYSGHLASARLLSLPLSDRKKLEKIIPFEIEGHMPLDLDQVHHDWDILSKGEDEGDLSQVLAVSVFRDNFTSFFAALQNIEIDPRDITLDSLALSFLAEVALVENDQCLMFLDCGHSKTNVCIVQGPNPLYTRSIGIAGREFTRALENDFKLTFLEAETLKQTDGQIVLRSGPGVTPEAERISQTIRRGIDDLAAEIRQTMASCQEIYNTAPSEVHLIGGSARLRNFAPYLTTLLEIPVKRVSYFPSINVQEFADEQAYSLQTALALALRGKAQKSQYRINFRKGEFRQQKSFQSTQAVLGQVGTLLGIFLAFLIVYFFARGFLLSAQAKSTEKEIQAEVRKVIPNFQFRGPRHALSVLQERMRGDSPESAPLERATGVRSPLIVLHHLSDAIPEQMQATFTEINIDDTNVRLEGSTDSRESVGRIRENLDRHPSFTNVAEQKLEKSVNGYVFALTLSLTNEGGTPK